MALGSTQPPTEVSTRNISWGVIEQSLNFCVCADKTTYMVTSRDQKVGRNHSVRIDNSTFEKVEEFKYLGTTLTIKILFRKKLRAD